MVWTRCNVSRHCVLFLAGRNVIIGCVDSSKLAECVQTLGNNCGMHINKIGFFDGVYLVQCVQTLSNYFWHAGMF